MGQWLSERLGQQFVIDNRPGGGTNIGTETAVRAAADGYTLLLCSVPSAINATLYDKLNFDFIRDIAAVAGIISLPEVMVVNPSVPTTTIPEFIAYAKANPGKISMASGGIGTPGHLSGELFKTMTGVNMIHVPYHGVAPALTDLLGGQVQVAFVSVPSSIGHIRTGNLRALAVTTVMRAEALPHIPTFAEFVPGYEATSWYGVGAPKKTPTEIVDKLNSEINAALADPKIKARLADPDDAHRLWKIYRRRNREVGQGNPSGQHQGGVTQTTVVGYSVTPVTRLWRGQCPLWVKSGHQPHSITSSARPSSNGGTSRSNALAVLRLMTSSNFVGAWIGRSTGFSPLRMRSMYSGTWRNCSTKSVP